MTRIADLRTTIRTREEADAAFSEFALVAKRLAVADAKHELRLANLTQNHRDRTAADRDELAGLRERIARYIDANRPCFQKPNPRTRKTDQGEYGLRTATELLITSEEALFNTLMDRGYDDCMETVRKPVKPAIRERLKAGEALPGCMLNKGDTVVCKVAKALLDQAKEEAVA